MLNFLRYFHFVLATGGETARAFNVRENADMYIRRATARYF